MRLAKRAPQLVLLLLATIIGGAGGIAASVSKTS